MFGEKEDLSYKRKLPLYGQNTSFHPVRRIPRDTSTALLFLASTLMSALYVMSYFVSGLILLWVHLK